MWTCRKRTARLSRRRPADPRGRKGQGPTGRRKKAPTGGRTSTRRRSPQRKHVSGILRVRQWPWKWRCHLPRRAGHRLAGIFEATLWGPLKRRAAEVHEKHLSPEERQEFAAAKSVEVRNFVASGAFEALPDHLVPSRDQAIGMRWILTWKMKDDGSHKAKARAVLLGYQDPAYEHRSTTAPVMSRQSRQLFLQLAAHQQWQVQKGDVSGAFLQGREYPDKLFCVPCDEICDALQIPHGSITRLRRACYGLVDAPLEWYRTVSEFFESLGLTRLWSDACAWVWRPDGITTRGMITGHVDDFLFGGKAEDAGWQHILQQIQHRFKWGDWDKDNFVQCGVQITRTKDGFELSQPRYLESISEIPLSSSRRKEKNHPVTERERSRLRALLGGLSWHAQQVAPHLAAEVSLLLSEVTKGTVNTVLKANHLLYTARCRKDHKMIIHGHSPGQDLGLYAWVDAANGNRPDGGSTQGCREAVKLGALEH